MQVGHSEIFGESSGFTQTVLWFWVYKCLVGICQLDIPKRCLTLDTFVLLYMHFLFLRPWRLLIVWSFNACKQCKRNKQPTSHAGRNLVRPYHDDFPNSGLLPDGWFHPSFCSAKILRFLVSWLVLQVEFEWFWFKPSAQDPTLADSIPFGWSKPISFSQAQSLNAWNFIGKENGFLIPRICVGSIPIFHDQIPFSILIFHDQIIQIPIFGDENPPFPWLKPSTPGAEARDPPEGSGSRSQRGEGNQGGSKSCGMGQKKWG